MWCKVIEFVCLRTSVGCRRPSYTDRTCRVQTLKYSKHIYAYTGSLVILSSERRRVAGTSSCWFGSLQLVSFGHFVSSVCRSPVLFRKFLSIVLNFLLNATLFSSYFASSHCIHDVVYERKKMTGSLWHTGYAIFFHNIPLCCIPFSSENTLTVPGSLLWG